MLRILLIKPYLAESSGNDILKRFEDRLLEPDIKSIANLDTVEGADPSIKFHDYQVAIFLVKQDTAQNKETMNFYRSLSQAFSNDAGKLLIPITSEPFVTKTIFDELNVEPFPPLEKEPALFYRDIDRIVKLIKTMATPLPNKEPLSFWLLKINENNWKINELQIGKRYFFNSAHHNKQKQNDLHYFEKLKVGDKIFAFALPSTRAIVAMFDVTQRLHDDRNRGEIIDIDLVEVLKTPIGTEGLESLDYLDQLNYDHSEKLYPIPANLAKVLSNPTGDSDKTAVKKEEQIRWEQSYTGISPDSSVGDNKLNIIPDVNALASLIALQEVSTPLAIGLFGNWGSGKSFFMRLLEKEVTRLTQEKSNTFCATIVPIWFNSWHYSDANLWASLSTKIFEELRNFGKNTSQVDLLYSKLNSTSQQVELTQKKIDQNAAAIKNLNEELTDKIKEIEDKSKELKTTSLTSIASKIFKNEVVQGQVDELEKRVDFVNWKDLDDVQKNAKEINTTAGKVKAIILQAYSWRKGKLPLAVFLFALFMFALYELNQHPEFLQAVSDIIKNAILWVTAISTQFLAFVRPGRKVINEVSEQMASLGTTISELQKTEKEELESTLSQLRKEVSLADTERINLKTTLDQLNLKQSLLKVEIDDIRTGKKIISFIEARAIDERYVKNLGMISWVRKDFDQLYELLKEQRNAKPSIDLPGDHKPPFTIDRIVLYIDDLDRCRKEIVVQVLEAIQLLLALPLFVVVVGVDPRWMENSLHEHFGTLLSKNGQGEITPAGYLEKIFQVPFKLKEVDSEGFAHLVDSQFPKKEDPLVPVNSPTDLSGSTKNQNNQSEPQTLSAQTGAARGQDVTERDVSYLIISDDERNFIKALQSVIPMVPRTIKRYVNIYRIVRSHGDFKFTDGQKLEYCKATMFLLAVMLSLPEQANEIFDLIRVSSNNTTLGVFLKKDKVVEKIAAISAATTAFISTSEGKKLEKIKINYFKQNLPLIERFSLSLTE